MADIDLPVFSFRPNWAAGVDERLSFMTDVIRATSAVEQRRQIRPTPRRSISLDLLLTAEERTFYDLFMNRLGGSEMMVPLFWDIATTAVPLVAGATDRINFDTAWREFQVGGLAILQRGSALTYEVVQIEAIDSTGIDLTAVVTQNWPAGTRLMPLRRSLLDEASSVTSKSAKVATASVRTISASPNPWTPLTDPATVYSGLPVFSEEPNWVDDLTVNMDRETFRLDNLIGRPYQTDPLGRALIGQAHRWFLPGRQKLGEFRDLIYRRAGRLGSFWLPTFKADLTLTASALSSATQITVKKIGYGYTGGPTGGREYIAIRHSTGTIYRKVLSVVAGLTAATERLNLDAPLGLALSPGQVRKISFMDTARFDQDDFEITHHNGIDGLHECAAVFRTFRNARTAPTPIHYPIPTSTMLNGPCGEVENTPCYFIPVFEGWYAMLRIYWINSTNSYPASYAWPDHGGQLFGNTSGTYTEEYLEYRWYNADAMNATSLNLRLQFSAGSVGDGMRARAFWQFWNEEGLRLILPKPGSLSEGDPFDVRGLWADNWYFDV